MKKRIFRLLRSGCSVAEFWQCFRMQGAVFRLVQIGCVAAGISVFFVVIGCTPEMARDISKIVAEGPGIAQDIYGEQNWNRTLSRATRTMTVPNFLIVNSDGTTTLADVEVAFVSRMTDVTYWCRKIFDRQRVANKCGCTIPRSPYRIVAIDPESARLMNGSCGLPGQTLHHEFWHLKGFYDHVQASNGATWPANTATKKVAPRRAMRTDDFNQDFR